MITARVGSLRTSGPARGTVAVQHALFDLSDLAA
jgi:hypothetical protein